LLIKFASFIISGENQSSAKEHKLSNKAYDVVAVQYPANSSTSLLFKKLPTDTNLSNNVIIYNH